MRPNLQKVVTLFQPDVDGYSDWVSIDDFQLLSHSHNQFKREQCVKCKNTNLRFSPSNNQAFKIGCEKWENEVGCMGCPLAQPELYR